MNVLHPETAMETFPHMLEPPSTFKDKCHEVGGSDDLVNTGCPKKRSFLG